MVFEYYIDLSAARSIGQELARWTSIMASFAIGVAVIGLIRFHWRNVAARKSERALFSAWTIICIVMMTVFGVFGGTLNTIFQYLFYEVLGRLSRAVLSLLVFFTISATFRAFRVRNLESAALFITVILILMGQTPLIVAGSSVFANIMFWITSVPSNAGYRGIIISAAVGAVALSIRTLLGRERLQYQ